MEGISFVPFGFMSDMMIEYDEYVYNCEKVGHKPLTFQEWWDSIE